MALAVVAPSDWGLEVTVMSTQIKGLISNETASLKFIERFLSESTNMFEGAT
jgi:hypothetical protein